MNSEQIFNQMTDRFPGTNFCSGLLLSLIDQINSLDPDGGIYNNLEGFSSDFPIVETEGNGKVVRVLKFQTDNGIISNRKFYNVVEDHIRGECKRYGYPSCAPHATQAWPDYKHWIDAIISLPRVERDDLRDRTLEFILNSFESHEIDPSTIDKDPETFREILASFDTKARKGEKSGAALQGIVFGFLRADNPHLQVEIDKVRTGSKRLGRIGDVDAWDGANVAISAEVKSYEIHDKDVAQFAVFAGEVSKRKAIGIVAATDFAGNTRSTIENLGVRTLSRKDMEKIVSLWDPAKQRIATSSFLYYATQIEKSDSLRDRIIEFSKTLPD